MTDKNNFLKNIRAVYQVIVLTFVLVLATSALMVLYVMDPELSAFRSEEEKVPTQELVAQDEDRIENGIHVRTGLKDAEGLMTVVQNCTACHSAKIITQNRMSAERWNSTIKWMQETQNLWDLGENQEVIVNYLVANYPPKKKGRRQSLTDIEWYVLED
jgi:hypothetical protein